MKKQKTKGRKKLIKVKKEIPNLNILQEFIKRLNLTGKVFLAGGFYSSIHSDKKIKDFDLYFYSKEDLDVWLQTFVKSNQFVSLKDKKIINHDFYATIMEEFKVQDIKLVYISNNALTFNYFNNIDEETTETHTIQIILAFCGKPKNVIDNFDFVHSMAFYEFGEKHIILNNEDVINCLENGILMYTGSIYPIASLLRARKFQRRGLIYNSRALDQILLDINDLDLSDPLVRKEQLLSIDLRLLHIIKGL